MKTPRVRILPLELFGVIEIMPQENVFEPGLGFLDTECNGIAQAKFFAWALEHGKLCKEPEGKLSSRWLFKRVITGIADAHHVKCSICKVEHDITDYSCW